MDEQQALKLAQEAFEASDSYYNANIRPNVDADLRQFYGKHPTGSKYYADAYKGRSKLFRPKTRTMIRKNEATAANAFFSTQDVINLTPANDNDPIQMAGADVMKELLQYRLTRTSPNKCVPWFMVCMGAFQDAQTTGTVLSKQYWEYDEKRKIDRPCIDLRPIENMRLDPGCSWLDPINTTPYLIDLLPMYVKDIKAKMKHDDPAKRWKSLSDAEILTAINNSGDSTRLTREAPRADPKSQTSAITDFTIVWVHENIIDMHGEDWVFYTLGDTHILSTPKPRDEVYSMDERPYVMGCTVLETHKVYKSGLPRITKDLQTEINEVANQRIDNVKFALNKRYFVRRNRQVDLRSLTRNVPSSVTMMTDPTEGGDVRIVSTPDVTGSAYQEQDRLNLDFDDIGGIFSQSSVQSNRNLNETVGGMNKLDANANVVNDYQMRLFTETWVEPVLRQLIKLEMAYETDEAVLALAGEKAKILEKHGFDRVTDAMLMQEMTLNVNVGVGATDPQQQLERFILGLNTTLQWFGESIAQKMDSDEVITELFGKLGYKDGKRFFKFEGDDPQMEMLMQHVQSLTEALNAKNPPELVKAQVERIQAEIEKIRSETVNKRVESVYSATQAAGAIASNPAVAPMGDDILRSGGFEDQDQPPIMPEAPSLAGYEVQDMPTNTNPMTPANPDVGMMTGIETPEIEQ